MYLEKIHRKRLEEVGFDPVTPSMLAQYHTTHRCYSPGNRKGEICEKKIELSYLARLYISYCEELIVSGVKNWVKVVKSMV